MSDSESDDSCDERNDEDMVRLKSSDLNFKDAPVLESSDFVLFSQYAASNNKVLRETCFKNLYCFAACLAMEHVALECPRTNMKNLWMLAFGNFSEVLNHYTLKDSSRRTLHCFPQGVWPPGFIEYCFTRNLDSSKAVPKKWLQRQKNEIANAHPDTYKQLYAGHKILGVVKRVKRVINNELNPLYKEDKIPSGLNSLHLLYAIRLTCNSICVYI